MRIKIIVAAFCLLAFTQKPSVDYRQAFGKDYTWAKNWLQQNHGSFEQVAGATGIPARELEAIVFPELIRYNSVYDALEIQSLKFLYVSQGSAYADFSVGYFQMKPSFAEQVEKDALTHLSPAILETLGFAQAGNTEDNEENRKARLQRITSVDGQLKYLAAFHAICSAKFSGQLFADGSEKIKFYGTAYNAGYSLSADELYGRISKKFFHTGKLIRSENYCYAEICADWFAGK